MQDKLLSFANEAKTSHGFDLKEKCTNIRHKAPYAVKMIWKDYLELASIGTGQGDL